MRPTGAGAPRLRCKDNYRQQKKDAGYFEPDDPAHATKRTQKTTHAPRDVAAGLCSGTAGRVAGNCRSRSRSGSGSSNSLRCTLRRAGQALASDASCDANADAKCAANGLRFHTVYDGNSDPHFRARAQLPIAPFRHRKYGS